METFYFILAFVFVLSFYAYSIRLRKDKVLVAYTQPTDDLAFVEAKKRLYYKKHKVYKDTEGKIINPKTMKIMFVSGNGMSPRINSGDEIIVIKFDKKKDLDEQIHRDDILLFFSEDKRMYYLREINAEYDSERIEATYYYYVNGERYKLEDRIENICGIVRYKIGAASMC